MIRTKHFVLTVLAALVSFISANAYDFEVDGIYYNYSGRAYATVTKIDPYASDGGYTQSVIDIPNVVRSPQGARAVTGIDGGAFRNCPSIVQINIPKSVTSIPSSAFNLCPNLETINVDSENAYFRSIDGVLINLNDQDNQTGEIYTSLWYCPAKKTGEYVIPSGVNNIARYSFYDCKDLNRITFNADIKAVQESAFWGCYGVTGFNVPAENQYFKSVDGILYTADNTEIVTLPNISAKQFTIPQNIRTIRYRAFLLCQNLEELTIPATVDNVGSLEGLRNLNKLTCLRETPPQCNSIGNIPTYKCRLVVPDSALPLYKATKPWMDFFRVTNYYYSIKNNSMGFGWTPFDWATGYEVQITSYPYAGQLGTEWENLPASSIITKNCSKDETYIWLENLMSYCNYYFRIKALSDDAYGNVWSETFNRRTGYKADIPVIDNMASGVYGTNGNNMRVCWSKVPGAVKYQLKAADKYSNTLEFWDGDDGILIDELLTDTVFTMVGLPYSIRRYFSVRSVMENGELSDWYYTNIQPYPDNNTRVWYFGLQTNNRYPVPNVIQEVQPQKTETTLTIKLNRNINHFKEHCDEELYNSYLNNPVFTVDANGNFDFQYMEVAPANDNPYASVGRDFKVSDVYPYGHKITAEEFAKGEVVITGLMPNSNYIINVRNRNRSDLSEYDNLFNTVATRTDGVPGAPVLLKHSEMIAKYSSDTYQGYPRSQVFELASQYNAAPISPVLDEFRVNNSYAENQEFWLEGGKTYYIDGIDITCKGYTLRTNPDDVAHGLRAKVICGIGNNSDIFTMGSHGHQWEGSYSMFMFGRQPEPGEVGEIYMKKLAFRDIDFDNPLALNYGDIQAGAGTTTGNYFFNMYSDGMAVTLDSLVIENCTFKRCVRGFIREQGVNAKVWNHVLIKNNQFFDCGYYNNGAGGYSWIAGAGTTPSSNLYKDMQVIENTFFDSPFPAFFSEERENNWDKDIKWNITFSNNTLVNFNTRANGSIFKMRNLPDGSVYNVKNNLMILTKKEGDQRILQAWGADIRNTMTRPDGSYGIVTLNFENNYSTNANLTNGQIFSSNPWTATSNNFGKLVKNGDATLNGTLEVLVDDISPEELMIQPNPPFVATSATDQNMHRTDALDGSAGATGSNLYFNDTDKVKNSQIYKLGIGAARWRDLSVSAGIENVENVNETKTASSRIYTISGQQVDSDRYLPRGIYIKNGKKIVVK